MFSFSPVAAKQMALTALQYVLSFVSRRADKGKTDSLVSFTKPTRVEPIVLVDQRAAHLPYMHDVMQMLSSVFSGYYLQAVSLAVNVGKINVIRLLDTLNPHRDMNDASAVIVDRINQSQGLSLLSMESYRTRLPVPGEDLGLESAAPRVLPKTKELKSAGIGDSIDTVRESANLSVGKILEVTIEEGGSKATFPITVRLISALMDSTILAHILSDGSRFADTARERWHAWRAGQLQFWRDLVLAQDLIDRHRATLMSDKSGVYSQILDRRTGNTAAGMMTETPSIGTASNLIVLTKQTVKELEELVGGKLSDMRVRDRVFKETYVMIMVVIDPEWEQITLYHRGIKTPTQLSIKELKSSNKGTGPDIGDILKAYQLGNSPTI